MNRMEDAMKGSISRVLLALLAAAIIPACGGRGGGGNPAGTAGSALLLGGGRAFGPVATTTGGAAGNVRLSSSGPLTFGVNPAKPASPTPPVPAPAPEITNLSADVVLAGSGQITGTLTGGGASSRTITVGGDLLISGTLRNGQFGGAPIDLTIDATNGTVYISGSILGTSNDGTLDGSPGGNIIIEAKQIVLTGRIESRGESTLASGGDGGIVVLNTLPAASGASVFVHGGTIDVSGGDGSMNGGDAGIIALAANDDVEVYGPLLLTGGRAVGSLDGVFGGDGGFFETVASDALSVNAPIDAGGGDATTTGHGARGGDGGFTQIQVFTPSGETSFFGGYDLSGGKAFAATTGAGAVQGGVGGALNIGNGTNSPTRLDFPAASIWLNGGESNGRSSNVGQTSTLLAGNGLTFNGSLNMDGGISTQGSTAPNSVINFGATTGDLVVNGNLSGNGSDGDTSPGRAQTFTFTADMGNIQINAALTANAGNAKGGVTLAGADADAGGTRFTFIVTTPGSTLSFSQGTRITSNGGAGAGDGNGGRGGQVSILTDGNVDIGGVHVLNGGAGAGLGTGGNGGVFKVLSDNDGIGAGGAITLLAGASIIASGGPGTIGGNGANQAVVFDADKLDTNGAAAGVVLNNGTIITTGGAADGNGGGVVFDGLNSGGSTGPAEGSQNRTGKGTGTTGAFTSQ